MNRDDIFFQFKGIFASENVSWNLALADILPFPIRQYDYNIRDIIEGNIKHWVSSGNCYWSWFEYATSLSARTQEQFIRFLKKDMPIINNNNKIITEKKFKEIVVNDSGKKIYKYNYVSIKNTTKSEVFKRKIEAEKIYTKLDELYSGKTSEENTRVIIYDKNEDTYTYFPTMKAACPALGGVRISAIVNANNQRRLLLGRYAIYRYPRPLKVKYNTERKLNNYRAYASPEDLETENAYRAHTIKINKVRNSIAKSLYKTYNNTTDKIEVFCLFNFEMKKFDKKVDVARYIDCTHSTLSKAIKRQNVIKNYFIVIPPKK